MDERTLLLLGILKSQSLHGYQINEFIDKNLSRIASMKKATAYAILDKLNAAGLISVREDQNGNRPPRKVYSITPAGEEEFYLLLRGNLSEQDITSFKGDIGLMFIDHLSKEEAIDCLLLRLSGLTEQIEELQQIPKHKFSRGIDLSFKHHLVCKQAERNWLQSVIEELKKE
ncbi:PadR family transcriptional regulator [Paenibacillus kribbensis]|uniref:PadR family transcriptional regulator n=1 Tax=Paenibacillus kribbensis TaxID=172713 RepID=A0A222WNS4_9BACL|nr:MULTISPECIES: PadR family transcriptional regulator [Paenibacillus]ASR47453.1 PadR family transcriptional regulator [Paenibacillus kribbensis]EHS57655.1 transcriptional regulator, PadR-like family [Paenibacillus sp. Aloe-11]MEC0236186.1 PadR family transcriptional regulator [Paenibacillus kribbensis]